MICPRCNEYFLDIEYQSHRIDELEGLIIMTQANPQTIAALADAINAFQPQVQQLVGGNDLSPIVAAVQSLNNTLNPAVPVEPTAE